MIVFTADELQILVVGAALREPETGDEDRVRAVHFKAKALVHLQSEGGYTVDSFSMQGDLR